MFFKEKEKITLTEIQKKTKKFPAQPGIYIMKNKNHDIIYIGKANSLDKRIKSYFQKKDHDPKTKILLKNINSLSYRLTPSEDAALILEDQLIKKFKPKFNFRLKDDKKYPYITITKSENYPRLKITRDQKNKNDLYFGPYPNATAAKNITALINKIFKLKTCSKHLPLAQKKRPCLNFQMNRCHGPCQKNISSKEYLALINDALQFINGQAPQVIKNLERKMKILSDNLVYEQAQQYRDIINDIKKILPTSPSQKKFLPPKRSAREKLYELQKVLQLPKVPEIIEGFDISNLQGKQAVGSMVSFVQGEPAKKNYRRYKIKTYDTPNDPGMIHEVVSRRLQFLTNENLPLPDLILIDGGQTQRQKALEAINIFGLNIKVISLAKKLEEIYYDKGKNPLRLKKNSPALHLLQQIRDEAHRFAIKYHRTLRGKKIKFSTLDNIPGIGPKTKKILLEKFKSVEKIKLASLEDLTKVPGVGKKLAETIHLFLNKER